MRVSLSPMRWSWPAFAIGVSVGSLGCLVLFVDHEPEGSVLPPGGDRVGETAPVHADAPRAVRKPASSIGGAPSTSDAKSAESGRPRVPPADAQDTAPPGIQGTTESVTATPNGFPGVTREDGPGTSFGATYPEITLQMGHLTLTRLSEPTVNRLAAQGLARVRAAAEALFAEGRAGAADDLDALLRSSDDGDREAAIGSALRSDPPDIARLLRVARDNSVGGSLRSTALLAATEAAPASAEVGAAVVDLTEDKDPDVRRTAYELLARVGPAGADRAVALLRDGDFPGDLLVPLARTVGASDRALDFLLDRPHPETAFAIIATLDTRMVSYIEDFDVELANTSFIADPIVGLPRGDVLARLPDVVRPLLHTAEMLVHADMAFGVVAAAGHSSFLRSVAVTTSLPTSIRLAAVNAAVNAPACADGRPSLLAAALADGTSPVEFLRATLQRVPQGDVADGGVRAAILALAESHTNAWLREEARARLQGAPRNAPEDGSLRIVSGVYGKDGKTVEVTGVLASMVVGGRLVVEAGNALAGDPLVGIVKDLAVAYTWKGERRTRTIREYETLTLP